MWDFKKFPLPHRKAIRLVVHWLLALAFLTPGLAIFFISVSKLSPAARLKWVGWDVFFPGVIMLGEVSTLDTNQDQIYIRWAIGGWGEGFGWHDDDDSLWPYPGLPSLSRPALFVLDGQPAWLYDPTQIIGSDMSYSAANQFTSQHTLNAYTDNSYGTLFSATHYVDIGVQIVDPNTNDSLTIADMSCSAQAGPALTGWTITSQYYGRGGENGTDLPNSPLYTIRVTLSVDQWNMFYEILMGFMILLASIITLISTAHLIRIAWSGTRDVKVAEVLPIPSAVGSIIAALRTAFPPTSDLEIFLNEAIYYPCFVLAVWCVMAGVIATRSVSVNIFRRLRAYGEPFHPFEGLTEQKVHDLEKSLQTPKETEAEEELQYRMRSGSASRTVSARESMIVVSPESLEQGEEERLLANRQSRGSIGSFLLHRDV